MLPGNKILKMMIFLAAFYLSDQTTTKEQQFKLTVQEIIDGFSKQDSIKVSAFINKRTGIYQLDRVGVFDHYNHFKTVTFSDNRYPAILFQNSKGIKRLRLLYASLPTYDCAKETWSKRGLFVDTTKTDHLLSQICNNRNKYRPDTISVKTIQSFYKLENKSRRIVLYDDNENELVFYLSFLSARWYLTIIDYVTSDCSV
jgi:hypothetical protein